MEIFALKLLLVPVLIAALSIALPRFGPTVAGLLAGLPSIAGPVFAIMVFEHGTAFGVRAAASSLAGVTSTALFAICYAWTCLRLPWYGAVLSGCLGFAAATLFLNALNVTLGLACAIGLAVPLLGGFLFPRVIGHPPRTPLPRSEIVLRMIAGAAMVFVTTELGAHSGPQLAGLFLPFPIAGMILAAFSHHLHGGSAAIQFLKGMIGGMASNVAFFIVAALSLDFYGAWTSIVLSLLGAVAVQGGTYLILRRLQLDRA